MTETPQGDTPDTAERAAPESGQQQTVVVVGPDGRPVGTVEVAADTATDSAPTTRTRPAWSNSRPRSCALAA